jgi:hypothetical protein
MVDLGSILARDRRKLRISQPKKAPKPKERAVPTAELVECTCPDPCQRDHETD